MISLLGENYILHPHRYWHCRPPSESDPNDREQIWEQVKSNSHQDSYSPSGQPRGHHLRYARFMYYSHAVAEVNGPTYVIPGSQFHSTLIDDDRQRQIPVTGRAGTVFLSHFDIGHAGGVNLSKRVRNMIKFIFIRTDEPTKPTWNCRSTQWQKPLEIAAHDDLESVWRHHWNWLCGNGTTLCAQSDQSVRDGLTVLNRSEDLHQRLVALNKLTKAGPKATSAVATLAALLNSAPQPERTCAIYALAAVGCDAIKPLIEILVAAGERESFFDVPSCFNDSVTSMDDAAHALAAMGDGAVEPLVTLLDSPYEWTRLNAVFALGEIGARAGRDVTGLTELLDDPSYRVIHFATSALGKIGDAGSQAALCNLLDRDREDWGKKVCKDWPVRHLLHANAAMALAKLGSKAADSEAQIIRHLNHPFGQTGIFVTEALRRIGTPSAIDAVVKDLDLRRWDASLNEGQQY